MTREQAMKELEEINKKLDAERTMDPRGPAGAFSEPVVMGDRPPAAPAEPTTMQSVGEALIPSAASMAGGVAGARAVAPVAAMMPHPALKVGTEVLGAVAGAGLAGAGADLTVQGVKKTLGLPGAPDSIDEALNMSLKRGSDEAMGEVWGQGIGAATSKLLPFRKAVTPESAELFKTQGDRLRAAYESIGGAPLMEETRAIYNPMRWLQPVGSELEDHAVVKRLKAAGVDPEAARKVALGGGMQPSEIDNSTFSKLWGITENTKVSPDLKYDVARSKLMHVASLEDLGTKFADQIPPEKVGQVVSGALQGRFDTLNAARRVAMNAIDDELPDMQMVILQGLKKRMPKDLAGGELVQGLPDAVSFGGVQDARMKLGSMLHDTRLDPTQKAQVGWLIDRLDGATRDSLPAELKGRFQKWTDADREANRGTFDNAFVRGLLQKEPIARKYANTIINNADAESFGKLETALRGAPDGEKIIGQVKGAIGDRFLSAASKDGVLQPAKLHLALGTEAKGYGKHFLNATMGPDYVKNLEGFATSMDTINDAAKRAGHFVGMGRGVLTLAAASNGLRNVYNGQMSSTDALTVAAALFAPTAVSKMLTSRTAGKLLTKAAENVAAGRNPRTTARLAGRALELAGLDTDTVLGGMGILPQEQAASAQQQMNVVQGQAPPMTGGAPTPVM